MRALRIVAVIGALALMIGEIWRSWGVGRPIAFVLDDQIAGALMIWGAIAVRHETVRSRALFSAGWGVAAGMLYGSFFGKVFDPSHAQPGNWNLGVLTALLGVAFAIAIIGLIASIRLRIPESQA